jgi:hypothetical protein
MPSKNNTANKFAKNQQVIQEYLIARPRPLRLPPLGISWDLMRRSDHTADFDRAAEAFARYTLAATCSPEVAARAMLENGWKELDHIEEGTTNFQAICRGTARLLEFSLNAGSRHSVDRVVYLGQNLAETITIGEALNEIGGIDLMRRPQFLYK